MINILLDGKEKKWNVDKLLQVLKLLDEIKEVEMLNVLQWYRMSRGI